MPFLATIYVIWAVAFIYNSSFIAIDKHRYFSLFDDGMISMRYAYNFVHGRGLVWNVGQRVEGYSNLLMVLLMSAVSLLLHRSSAVLAIQMIGIPFIIGAAWVAMQIYRCLDETSRVGFAQLGQWLVFVAVLAYYPLSFWGLMGMENALLALLLTSAVCSSLAWIRDGETRQLAGTSVLLGLAFLTRNDSLIYGLFILGYLAIHARNQASRLRSLILAAAVYTAFISGQEGFRYLYYHSWVPNTYVLKLVGMGLAGRLRNGLGFIAPFLVECGVILLVGLAETLISRRRQEWYVLSLALLSVIYQVYVGGDPWQYWRMMSPTVPLILVVFVMGGTRLAIAAVRGRRGAGVLAVSVVVAGLALSDFRFLPEMALAVRPGDGYTNVYQINTAIALDEVTRENATVGVFFAGAVPYYTDRMAIDFLGKSDWRIARLAPDVSGRISGAGMYSIPGHNKYDLNYSIGELRPTYVESFKWGSQDLTSWASEHYVHVRYKSVSLYLLKDSPAVRWDRVEPLQP